MSLIRCIIVDDEPLALDLLEGYVNKTPFLKLVARCNSPFDALQVIQTAIVDLVFLDIQMPGITGVELSHIVKNGPKIIFTTAYSQFALDGFKVDALDYLVKPINYQEFIKSANKALTWFSLVGLKKLSKTDSELSNTSIFVKSEYKLIKVELSSIQYIEGLKDYVKIYISTQAKPILSLMSLKTLEEKLPCEQFMRVHRSFIVNLQQIAKIDRNRVVFGTVYIPIAESYKKPFQEYLNKKSWG
jgi:DNA-binding LytR/AlgR family response regulator